MAASPTTTTWPRWSKLDRDLSRKLTVPATPGPDARSKEAKGSRFIGGADAKSRRRF